MIKTYLSRLFRWLRTNALLGLRLFSDPQVYLELLAKPWLQTLMIFLVVTGLIGGLTGLQVVHQWGAQLLQLPQAVSDEWVSHYPANSIIQWQNATLTVVPAPTQAVVIPWPAALVAVEWPGPLAIYDPHADTQPAELVKTLPQPPLFVLNQKSFWTNNSDGQWTESFPLTDSPFLAQGDRRWDKAAIVELLGQTVAQLRHWLKVGIAVWPIISIGLNWLGKAWFVLTQATVIWILGRLVGWNLSWRRLIKLTLLLVPAAEVIGWLGQILYPHLGWSLFYPAFWILWGYLNLQFPQQLLKPATVKRS